MNGIVVAYDDSSDHHYVDVPVDEAHDVGEVIVYAVGEILDQDPISLQPLGAVVDPDSLTANVDANGEADSDVSVTFDYSGFVVTVHGNGRITFEEIW